jgi:hypothetical protein
MQQQHAPFCTKPLHHHKIIFLSEWMDVPKSGSGGSKGTSIERAWETRGARALAPAPADHVLASRV